MITGNWSAQQEAKHIEKNPLYELLDKFTTTVVKTPQELLRVPLNTKVTKKDLESSSIKLPFDPNKDNTHWRTECEEKICQCLEDRVKAISPKITPDIYELINLVVLGNPSIPDVVSSLTEPTVFNWIGRFYIPSTFKKLLGTPSPYTGERLQCLYELQKAMDRVKYRGTGYLMLDTCPNINRGIGKTGVMLDKIRSLTFIQPEYKFYILSPHNTAQKMFKDKFGEVSCVHFLQHPKSVESIEDRNSFLFIIDGFTLEDICPILVKGYADSNEYPVGIRGQTRLGGGYLGLDNKSTLYSLNKNNLEDFYIY